MSFENIISLSCRSLINLHVQLTALIVVLDPRRSEYFFKFNFISTLYYYCNFIILALQLGALQWCFKKYFSMKQYHIIIKNCLLAVPISLFYHTVYQPNHCLGEIQIIYLGDIFEIVIWKMRLIIITEGIVNNVYFQWSDRLIGYVHLVKQDADIVIAAMSVQPIGFLGTKNPDMYS